MRAAAVHISGCGSFLSPCPLSTLGPEADVAGKAGSFWDHRYSQGSRGSGWSDSCLLLSIGHRAGAPSSPEAGEPPPHTSPDLDSFRVWNSLSILGLWPLSLNMSSQLNLLPFPTHCCLAPDLICPCLWSSCLFLSCLSLTSAMVSLSPLISFCLSSLSICNSGSDFPEGAG